MQRSRYACDKKFKSWRQKSANCALLDLCNAYMQISVADECSKYQIFKFDGNIYKLSRLDCAPKIIKAVVSKLLSLDEKISEATDHYYDDIMIDLNVVSAQ